MAPRSKKKKSTVAVPNSSEAGSDHESNVEKVADSTISEATKELCPQCKADTNEDGSAIPVKEDWVRCDACKVWFHWRCAGEGDDLETIDKWFCRPCRETDSKRVITRKPPARKSTRKKAPRDYASLHNGTLLPQSAENGPGTDKWLMLLHEKEKTGAIVTTDPFRRLKGNEVTLDWLNEDEEAMKEPIVIESPEGLGMKMPAEGLTVDDVAKLVGEDAPVEVMDVATQTNTPGYTLGKWAEYYRTPASEREKILNVISLEVSETELGAQILPPRLVREVDWVEKFWPANKRGRGHVYPKVQLYCLMGVANAWTDWHIDFAGSSVYYHIFRGSKVFYFVEPTQANLVAYERWSGSALQMNTWLGDLVDKVVKVELKAGNTMIIPTGWIHAVFTPTDTLVFGGNFLHSYNIPTQLRVREIEVATHVPKKFRFPFFKKLCWYVADSTLRSLKAREEFTPRVLESLKALCAFLMTEVHAIERGDEHRKKEAREQVPGDRIRDAPALARELRWRLRMAAHGTSDSEGSDADGAGEQRKNGVKRKRGSTFSKIKEEHDASGNGPRFKNFVPKKWDAYNVNSVVDEKMKRKVLGPREGDEWTKAWMEGQWSDGKEEKMEVDEVPDADVERKREVLVRVRRTANGIERQKIERTVEHWEWPVA